MKNRSKGGVAWVT